MKTPLEMLDEVAAVLQEAHVDGVFAGGAVLPLLVDAVVAAELRPTFDVDVIVSATSYAEYQVSCRSLARAGFSPGLHDGDPMCRYRRGEIAVDVMPTPFEGLGTDNPWFGIGLATSTMAALPTGRMVRVLCPPVYLATKIAAFHGRGEGDHLGSKDFEDIVALLDGRATLPRECIEAPAEVRRAIRVWAAELLKRQELRDLVAGHVSRASGRERWRVVVERLRELLLGCS